MKRKINDVCLVVCRGDVEQRNGWVVVVVCGGVHRGTVGKCVRIGHAANEEQSEDLKTMSHTHE